MLLNKAKVLSEKEIIMIDEASKEILEETGVKVLSNKVLEIYKKNGAYVDFENMIVKIPRKITEKFIKSAPAKFRLYSRDKEGYLEFGDNIGYCASGHNAIYMIDQETFERRPVSKKEVGNFAKISDYLENIHVVGVQAMPQDVPPKSTILHAVDAVLNNTGKPIFFSPENVNEARELIEIIKIVSDDNYLGNESIAICQLSPISPLKWSQGTAEAVVEIAKSGMPLCFLPEPYSGVTSPLTLAGTLVVNNAEELSGIVLTQMVNEGTSVIYGAAWTTFEMNKGTVLIGTPEKSVLCISGAQMSRYYGLPSHSTSFDTDSNIYDEQNGFEKIFNTIANLQSGINLIVNAGMFSTGFTVSYEQLIIDHEIVSFVYRYLNGMKVDYNTIAKDVIKNVGQDENYMGESHTIKYLRSDEHTCYKVSNREIYEKWRISGKHSIVDNAKNSVKEILDLHKPKPLSNQKKEKIERIISKFESVNK